MMIIIKGGFYSRTSSDRRNAVLEFQSCWKRTK